MRATDAIRLCREGDYDELGSSQTDLPGDVFRWPHISSVRQFVVDAHLTTFPVACLRDDQLLAMLKAWVRSKQLVAIRTSNATARRTGGDTAAQRRLVREIETRMGGRLSHQGRQYRLVADVDLSASPDRDSYEVCTHAEAQQLMDAWASTSGAHAGLAALLTQARERLSPDWRLPLSPQGLILLRRIQAPQAAIPSAEPPITPSEMKKLLNPTEWIEVVVLEDDEVTPYTGTYRIELPEAASIQGRFDDEGLWGNYDITPGTCVLTLSDQASSSAETNGDAGGAGAAEDTDEEGAAPTEDACTKLRLKLLDLDANVVCGAKVALAGDMLTTDDDGFVEKDLAAASSLKATLPTGDIELDIGGLDADDDSDDACKIRLHNMGFLWDPDTAQDDDEMVIAIEDFQAQYGVDISGELDDATKAKLMEVYGC